MAKILFSLMLALLCAGCATTPEFEPALQRHLAAIQHRDLTALESTLTSGDDLVLILPNGTMTRTKAEFLAFHREWFAEPGWRMRFDPLMRRITRPFAQVLFRTRYEGPSAEGAPIVSRSYLTMTFRLERGSWRLVHDQNTRLSPEAASALGDGE